MKLSVIAPNHSIFNGSVDNVRLPSDLGPFQVFHNHAPTLSSLTTGDITYTIGTRASSIAIKSGFVSIDNNEIKVVCEPM